MLTAIDAFCGAGGSTTGMKAAGIRVIHAANHWDRAIETHNTNHQEVDHSCCNLSNTDPRSFPKTDIGWFSPSCTAHSPAGGRRRKNLNQLHLWESPTDPAAQRSRMTAWDVVSFTEVHRYQAIIVENVVEFTAWELFDCWLQTLDKLGYQHKVVCLNSQFCGVPQSRDRIYLVFWRKGNHAPDLNFRPLGFCQACQEQVNFTQTWKGSRRIGSWKQQYVYTCPQCGSVGIPYRTAAATALDWSLPCPPIEGRGLCEATLNRIRRGLQQFSQPSIVTLRQNSKATSIDAPITTLCTSGTHHGLVVPPTFLAGYHGGRDAIRSVTDPAWTIATENQTAVVQPFLSVYHGKGAGASQVSDPSPTLCTGQQHALVEPIGSDLEEMLARSGYRMLRPHEAKQLQGFGSEYQILGNQKEQFRQIGNAVTPNAATVIGRAVVESLERKVWRFS